MDVLIVGGLATLLSTVYSKKSRRGSWELRPRGGSSQPNKVLSMVADMTDQQLEQELANHKTSQGNNHC